MNVIVTGSAGFVGCNLTERLIEKGYKVYAFIRPGSSHNERLEKLVPESDGKLILVECDMSNILEAADKITDKCEVFYHLAWADGRDDFARQYSNIDQTLNALTLADKLGCKRFVATGSQAEYGLVPKGEEQTEETPLKPNTAYGACKVAAYYLLKRRCEQIGMEFIWGRIFSIYGKYEGDGRLIVDLTKAIQRGERKQMTAATQNWDYLYTSDAADALIALAEKGRAGEIYNIANGDYHELKFFTDQIASYYGDKEQIEYGSDSRTPVSLQPSVSKIFADTGWKPSVDFMDGIKKVYGTKEATK